MPPDDAPSPSGAPPTSIGVETRDRWMLDPDIAFLNHGCFGARLRSVFTAQQGIRERFEARPVEFLDRDRDAHLQEAKVALGEFLGMKPPDFGFTTNATDGANAVLRSLRLAPGDEILTSSHVYNALRQTMRFVADRAGAEMVEVDIPLPVRGPDEVVRHLEAGLTNRTRLLVLDHITSPTALRLPVERILTVCDQRKIDVLIDGAHAPGMIELDVEALGAAYYTGNLHKWVGAPPGAGFLWVRPDKQPGVHPTVISHFLNEGLAEEFAWQGTRDISAWLTVPTALAEMDQIAGVASWPRIMQHNHQLAAWVQATLVEAWGVEPNSPLDGSMLGSMASVTVPEPCRAFETTDALQAKLYRDHQIEVPVIETPSRWLIRPCCQIYNTPEQYERLARAILELVHSPVS